MKCPECGYVSFDEDATCKGCGAGPGSGETAATEEHSPLQDELFLQDSGDEGAPETVAKGEGPEAGDENTFRFEESADGSGEAPVALPEMHIDYDPAEEDLPPSPPAQSESAGGEDADGIIDDDTDLPDEIWLEESAGFLLRSAAFAVDALILTAVLALFGIGAFLALGPGESGLGVFAAAGVIVAFYLLSLLLSLGYYTFFVGWAGRTPGKRLLRLDVRRNDGGPMTYGRAFLRWAGYLVSFTFVGLGFFWVIFDERKKGWHDYLSGTWVKDLRHEE